jgi:hypothetical protein
MIRFAFCLALVLAACAPVAAPPASPLAACEAQGGRLMRVGRLQSEQCVLPYGDAGKACTDGDQCEGQCIGRETAMSPGQNAVGACQAEHPMFGCFATIEDGRVAGILCID